MAIWYVGTGGSDAAAGSSWATAWLTIGHALAHTGTSATVAGGDTIYVGPGVYRTTGDTVSVAPGSTLSIIGDVDGSHTSGAPGEVIYSAWGVNDTTQPVSTNTCVKLNGKSNFTFQNITFNGGRSSNGGCIDAQTTGASANITLQWCNFDIHGGSAPAITAISAANTAMNWTIDGCNFSLAHASGGITWFMTQQSAPASDYNVNNVIHNCHFEGGSFHTQIKPAGAGTNFGGGLAIDHCTHKFAATFAVSGQTSTSSTFPATVTNSLFVGQGGALSSGSVAPGQVIDGGGNTYNVGGTDLTNVTRSGSSASNYAYNPRVSYGQERYLGTIRRPWSMPLPGSPLFGFGGATASPASTSYDNLNRPRPAGGGSATAATGCLEYHQCATAGGGGNAYAGLNNCYEIVGPGDHDIQIPVDASATVITVYQKTSGYSGTNYPQVVLLANAEIGVTTQTVADTAANTSYTALAFASITPTAAGVVTVRLQNLTGNGTGIVYWGKIALS